MSRSEPSTNLPVPYRSPWRALGEDLRAVAATLRLGLQELWRRNGQGDLPRPALWPRDLAPLFWPLLLVVALAALLLVGLGLGQRLGDSASGLAKPESLAPPAEIPLEIPQEIPATRATADPADAPQEPRSEAPAPETPEPEPNAPGAATAETSSEAAAAAPGPTFPPDPLAELLASPAAAGLLRTASAEPASAGLQLVLAEDFLDLPGAEQQRRADAWLQLALGLGYEHLQLRDAHGALMGREAVVGGGMILLSPAERN